MLELRPLGLDGPKSSSYLGDRRVLLTIIYSGHSIGASRARPRSITPPPIGVAKFELDRRKSNQGRIRSELRTSSGLIVHNFRKRLVESNLRVLRFRPLRPFIARPYRTESRRIVEHSEGSLTHKSRSFTVEMRRRRGRPSAEHAKPILGEEFTDVGLGDACGADKTAARITDPTGERVFEAAPAGHAGRILPSLVESSSWLVTTSEIKPSQRRANGADLEGRSAKRDHEVETDAADSRRPNSPRSQADARSMTSLDAARHLPPQARSNDALTAFLPSQAKTSTEAERSAEASTAGKSPQRRARRAETHKNPQTAPTPTDVELWSIPDARPANPSKLGDGASQKRRRTVMARYVFRTELKLGERWKRRLRHVH